MPYAFHSSFLAAWLHKIVKKVEKDIEGVEGGR